MAGQTKRQTPSDRELSCSSSDVVLFAPKSRFECFYRLLFHTRCQAVDNFVGLIYLEKPRFVAISKKTPSFCHRWIRPLYCHRVNTSIHSTQWKSNDCHAHGNLNDRQNSTLDLCRTCEIGEACMGMLADRFGNMRSIAVGVFASAVAFLLSALARRSRGKEINTSLV